MEIASLEIDEHLEGNPQLILALLESDLLPVTGLAQAVEADVRSSTADFGESFRRAYAQLTDQTLGPLALKWLKGQKLTPGEMKDLGLSVAAIESSNPVRASRRACRSRDR